MRGELDLIDRAKLDSDEYDEETTVYAFIDLGRRSSGSSTATGSSHRYGSRSGDAPSGFEFLNEIRGFYHGQFAQLVNDRCNIRHVSFQSRRPSRP